MSLRILGRGLLVLLLDAVALLLLSEVLPGFVLDGAPAALGAAAAIGVLNALVWPLLARVALPLTVLTLGLGALLLNAILVTVAINLIPGAEVAGVPEGIVITIGISALTAIFYSLLAIDEDDTWYRNVVGRQARRRSGSVDTDVPGIVFLEIDGLAHDVLRRAIADGSAPHLAAGCGPDRIGSSAGKPTGHPRPAPARPVSCTATTTTCRPSVGGRRTATPRSSPITPTTPNSSSAAIPTGRDFSTPTAPAAPTSSPATRRTRC